MCWKIHKVKLKLKSLQTFKSLLILNLKKINVNFKKIKLKYCWNNWIIKNIKNT